MKKGENVSHDRSWTWIWKIKAPKTIKFLIWLACHNGTPTCSLLHHRGMLQPNVCQRCQIEEETFIHCVRDCHISKRMWQSLGFRHQEFFQEMDMSDFLRYGTSGQRVELFLAGL